MINPSFLPPGSYLQQPSDFVPMCVFINYRPNGTRINFFPELLGTYDITCAPQLFLAFAFTGLAWIYLLISRWTFHCVTSWSPVEARHARIYIYGHRHWTVASATISGMGAHYWILFRPVCSFGFGWTAANEPTSVAACFPARLLNSSTAPNFHTRRCLFGQTGTMAFSYLTTSIVFQ